MDKHHFAPTLNEPVENGAGKGEEKMETLQQPILNGLHNIHVMLNYGPLGIVRAATEAVARDHIRVNTGAVSLQHNTEVEVVLSIPGSKHTEHHRLRALVSHCDASGHTTLTFCCCGRETMLALRPYLTLH